MGLESLNGTIERCDWSSLGNWLLPAETYLIVKLASTRLLKLSQALFSKTEHHGNA